MTKEYKNNKKFYIFILHLNTAVKFAKWSVCREQKTSKDEGGSESQNDQCPLGKGGRA